MDKLTSHGKGEESDQSERGPSGNLRPTAERRRLAVECRCGAEEAAQLPTETETSKTPRQPDNFNSKGAKPKGSNPQPKVPKPIQ